MKNIINGIEEAENENLEVVVKQFLIKDLKMESNQINILFRDIHRLPKAKNGFPEDGRKELPCPMIVAFIRQKDRNEAIRKAFKLKQTNLSIKLDLPELLNNLKGKMLAECCRLKSENPTLKYRPILQKEDDFVEWTTRIKWHDVKFTN